MNAFWYKMLIILVRDIVCLFTGLELGMDYKNYKCPWVSEDDCELAFSRERSVKLDLHVYSEINFMTSEGVFRLRVSKFSTCIVSR